MENSNEWHLMIVGGTFNGRDRVFSGDVPVVVGRSHTANVQLPESDADVSGRHVEFSVIDGVAHVRNLSKTRPVRVNGADVPMGEVAPVQTGDMVEMGGRVRIRLDVVPQPDGVATAPEAVPEATATAATKFFEGDGSLDVPTAVMEESSVTGSGGFGPVVRPPENPTSATRMPEGMTTATHVPNGMTSATHVPENLTSATRVPEAASQATSDSATRISGASEKEPNGDDSPTIMGPGEGPGTNILPLNVWRGIVANENRRRYWRRIMHRIAVGVGLFLVAAILVAIWFFAGTRKDVSWYLEDVRTYEMRNPAGKVMLGVDYPGNPNIPETPSPDGNGISVVTWYGERRDVPYFLLFEATSHPDELHLDLLASVRRWFAKAETSGEGFIFDERTRDELRPKFFEDVYPGSCEKETLYGIRFVEFEYKRTWPDGNIWHGWAHYFRSGDTVYLLRREIPEFYWERGGNRIRLDPNLAIYATFSDAYWESPGDEKLPGKESTGELMGNVSEFLARERASDWRFVRRNIDAVLARTWRTDSKMREKAESALRQYRDILRIFYNGKYNAFLTAKDNREEKKMGRIRQDAKAVFDDPDERYYYLVNNGEVW